MAIGSKKEIALINTIISFETNLIELKESNLQCIANTITILGK